jgi:hypothetical protein
MYYTETENSHLSIGSRQKENRHGQPIEQRKQQGQKLHRNNREVEQTETHHTVSQRASHSLHHHHRGSPETTRTSKIKQNRNEMQTSSLQHSSVENGVRYPNSNKSSITYIVYIQS